MVKTGREDAGKGRGWLGHRLWLWRMKRRRSAHLRLGRLGEWLSCQALREIGVDILCRNYKNSYGEIDIVGLEGTTLCFIEVKTRHRSQIGRPADAVDMVRRRRYGRAASHYLTLLGEGVRLDMRFDIVEVIFDGRRLGDIRYLRNAFRI